MEGWLSGRKRRTRNAVYRKRYREFESHPFRFDKAIAFAIGLANWGSRELTPYKSVAVDSAPRSPNLTPSANLQFQIQIL